jgi:hypothetical protein
VREPSVPLRIFLKIASVVVCALPSRFRRWWPLQKDEDLRGAAAISGLLEFLLGLNPLAPSFFLLAEGSVRFAAAFSSGQILPTLPLQIIAWIYDAKERKQVALQLGPLIPDEIERGKGKAWDLRVLSCRSKPHWHRYMTVRFEGAFYQPFDEGVSPGPRKFVYLLRRSPETRLVVVVFEYDPADVMTPDAAPRRWQP